MPDRAAFGQLWRFVAVGSLCTAVQYIILMLAVEAVGAPAAPASGAGYLASAALNYALNRRITFESGQAHRIGILRFLIIVASGLILTVLGMRLLHGYLRWHYLAAQVLVTLFVLLWNFAWHRHWTFAEVRRTPGT